MFKKNAHLQKNCGKKTFMEEIHRLILYKKKLDN